MDETDRANLIAEHKKLLIEFHDEENSTNLAIINIKIEISMTKIELLNLQMELDNLEGN